MRPRDVALAEHVENHLLRFHDDRRPLPGIALEGSRVALVEQIVESVRRVNYVARIRERDISARRTDPNDEMFDPIRAAIMQQRCGSVEETFWLVFLFVHFGKHRRTGWRTARLVYGGLGGGGRWDWERVSRDPHGFQEWLEHNEARLRAEGAGGFGNHRKYQSLKAHGRAGTGAAVLTYVAWVSPPRTHVELAQEAWRLADGNPRKAFDHLYRSLGSVASFGRLAKFDYLCMLGKLGLAAIEPGSTYMEGATGPFRGARRLFGSAPASWGDLEPWLTELGDYLSVGMQVIEDSICNWAKSPNKFVPFRG